MIRRALHYAKFWWKKVGGDLSSRLQIGTKKQKCLTGCMWYARPGQVWATCCMHCLYQTDPAYKASPMAWSGTTQPACRAWQVLRESWSTYSSAMFLGGSRERGWTVTYRTTLTPQEILTRVQCIPQGSEESEQVKCGQHLCLDHSHVAKWKAMVPVHLYYCVPLKS